LRVLDVAGYLALALISFTFIYDILKVWAVDENYRVDYDDTFDRAFPCPRPIVPIFIKEVCFFAYNELSLIDIELATVFYFYKPKLGGLVIAFWLTNS
jgi:hypothetical protein